MIEICKDMGLESVDRLMLKDNYRTIDLMEKMDAIRNMWMLTLKGSTQPRRGSHLTTKHAIRSIGKQKEISNNIWISRFQWWLGSDGSFSLDKKGEGRSSILVGQPRRLRSRRCVR